MRRSIIVCFVLLISSAFGSAQNKNALSFDLIPTVVSISQFAIAAGSDEVCSQLGIAVKYTRTISDHFRFYYKSSYFQQALNVPSTGFYESIMSISEFAGIQWGSSHIKSGWSIGFQLENTDWFVIHTSNYASGNAYYFGIGIPVGYDFLVGDNLCISASLGWSIGWTYGEYLKEFEFINNPILNTMEFSIGYRF
jgi:hypothetical protein